VRVAGEGDFFQRDSGCQFILQAIGVDKEAVVFFFQAQHFLRHLALVSAKVLVSCLKRLLAGIYI